MFFDEVIALRKAFETVKERQKKDIPPDLNEKKLRLKKIRESSVGNEDLLKRAIEKLEGNGIKVFPAKNKEEALALIMKEIGSEKLVVKSKSNVTKEIELTEGLESKGIKVVETDVGDRFLQVLRYNPSHPTGPASHLSAKKIAEGLANFYGIDINEDPEDIVRFVRDELRQYLDKAHVGITGANALTAEEGAVLLAHNEGNIFQVIRKKKHIIVTAIDKIYPEIEDAITMLKILSFHATGSIIPSFVEIISGVSKTADIEKNFFKGVHSPEDVVVILVDNKRSEIISMGFKEILSCIDCGNCLLHCPMYNTIGNAFASGKNLGGKGLALSYLSDDEVEKKLELCLTCGHCREHCPLGIDVPSIIRRLRGDTVSEEIYYFLKSHILWLYYTVRLKVERRYRV
jgi:L-lactate dehydrogenase complex protein LldG